MARFTGPAPGSPEGEVLIREGEPVDALFILLDGSLNKRRR